MNIDTIMPFLMHSSIATKKSLTIIHYNTEGIYCHFDDMRKHKEISLGACPWGATTERLQYVKTEQANVW